MRILELGKFYWPHRGGIETLLRAWCEGFARRGAEVDCVVANQGLRSAHETINAIRVHRLGTFGSCWSTSICPTYLDSTRRYPADLWHAHFPNPLADLACLRGQPTTPLVLTYHSDVVRQARSIRLYQPILTRLLERATRIVVATPRHLECSAWLPPYASKCAVIPFGIDLARFEPTEPMRQRIGELRSAAGGRSILLTVGRLVGYKGQRYLIEAARDLDVIVWLVGTGPLESELQTLARGLRLGSRVRFWGSVDDAELPALLHACDVFVLPSITPNEAFGLVQLEAMACGRPVVSCALPSGVPFVNRNGVTGLVVPPADAAALTESLRRLLADPGWRGQLGAAGRARVEAEFAEGVMVERYWQLFTDLLRSARPA
ncbi:MAG: glycosyltransferase [Verrucomicrobia bacterium]|nr:glycosyltransferase [Verrucomicrobiota bacterium]